MKGSTWDSIAWKNGGLLLKNYSLQNSPVYQIKAQELHLDLFKKEMKINGLTFIFHKHKSDFPLEEIKKIFAKTPYKTSLENGKLLLYDYSGASPLFQKGEFSFKENHLSIELEPTKKIDIDFKEEGNFECQVQEIAVSRCFPFFYFFCDALIPKNWIFSAGEVSSQFSLQLSEGKCLKAKGFLNVHQLKGHNEKLKLMSRLDHLKSSFDFQFEAQDKSTCTIELKEGCLSLMGTHPEFWDGLWDFHLFSADILLKNGEIQSSKIIAHLLGMEGEIVLKTGQEDPLLNIQFKGHSKKMVSLLPQTWQKSFRKAFPDDDFDLQSKIRKTPLGLDLEGNLTIAKKNALHFGCHFPFSEKRVGWFQGNHFELEKFLSPFLFKEKDLHLSGECDFEGTFDDRFLTLYYRGKNLLLESPHFSFSCDKVQEGISKDIVACHYFDLKTKDHVGILPVKEGDYRQKNLNLHFEKASFLAFFENNNIEIREIKTKSESIEFQGDVKIHRDDLKISTHSIKGDLKAALSFLSHLFPWKLWKVPLDGNIESGVGGVFLHYKYEPKTRLVDAYVHGKVRAGYKKENLSLRDYCFEVEYDKKADQLELKEGRGSINLDTSSYTLSVPSLSFSDFPKIKIKGGLSLHSQKKEIFHCDLSYLDKNFFIKGQSFAFQGLHEKDSIVLESFKMGKMIGKGIIDWSGPKTSLKIEEFRREESEKGQTFSLFLDPSFFSSDSVGFKTKSTIFFLDQFYTAELMARKDAAYREGILTLREAGEGEPCLVYWKVEEGKPSIERIQGKISGLVFFLRKSGKGELSGQIAVDLKKGIQLFSQEIKNQISPFALEGNYLFDGDFKFDLADLKHFSFSGVMHGENLSVSGMKLESISSILSYHPERIVLKHFLVKESGGKAEIESAYLVKHGEKWNVSIPQVKLENVRLARLLCKNRKPFYIPSFSLDHFEGVLGDIFSFKGFGKLRFANISPKNFFTNLLYLPKEITARIGLDLSLLVPARGEIHYEIKNGMIHLLQLKGVYSEGKRSRFYLAEGYPATIDFDGNLNLKVKMKQYNLLMKVAELFVVTVRGDIFKPTYTLNQEDAMDENETP